MESRSLVLEILRFSHNILEMEIDRVAPETFFVPQPRSGVASAGAIYAHCVFDEDNALAEAAGSAPLFAAVGWSDRFGFEPKAWIDPEWAAALSYDIGHFRQYAAEVYARAESLISGGKVDLGRETKNYEVIRADGGVSYRERTMPAAFHLLDVAALHTVGHSGELAILANLAQPGR